MRFELIYEFILLGFVGSRYIMRYELIYEFII